MTYTKAVFFDVDGVLLDSLNSHLQICEDKSREYNLGLVIPDPQRFKETIVRKGIRISPMKLFFQSVGFPGLLAEMADFDYQQTFTRTYAPKPFHNVQRMLSLLASSGLQLGIISANVRNNIETALHDCMKMFNQGCIFTKDSHPGMSKNDALLEGAKVLHIDLNQCVYVGDQIGDFDEARKSGAIFIGVSYGWGISACDKGFPIANTVPELTQMLLAGGSSAITKDSQLEDVSGAIPEIAQ